MIKVIHKKENVIVIELALLILLTVFFFLFFHKLVFSLSGDYYDHIEVARIICTDKWMNTSYKHIYSYPLLHILIKIFAGVIGSYELATTCLMAFSDVVTFFLFYLIWKQNVDNNLKDYVVGMIVSFCSLIFMPMAGILTEGRIYSKQYGPNPVHNPTYLIMRPIGLLACILFISFIKKYNSEKKYRGTIIAFSIIAFFSLIAKPSFAIAFFPAMGIIVLREMMEKRDLKIARISFGAIFPSVIAIILQYMWISKMTSTSAKMIFKLGGYYEFGLLDVIKISVATFPVVLLAMKNRNASQQLTIYLFSILALITGWLEVFCFSNGPTGDFSWGYDFAVEFATFISLLLMWNERKENPRLINVAVLITYGYQVLVGMKYMYVCYKFFYYSI